MRADLERIRRAALADLDRCADEGALEAARLRYLGRKGELTAVLRGMRDVAEAERPAMGELANMIKAEVEERLATIRKRLDEGRLAKSLAEERLDVTLPGIRAPRGRIHPLMQVLDEIVGIFVGMGFDVAEGPEIEDDYHNFEALNIPRDHPARDMQDTFYLSEDTLLRTHTSPVQIRTMQAQRPPVRLIVPGRVYRRDADITHSPMFHQIEGLAIDRNISMGDLKGTLELFAREMFGGRSKIRFRPSFFPFTEPSAEVDVLCFLCGGSGCRVCKQSGWLEILGSGMVHPQVLRNVGYDPEEVTGWAFGMGVERVAMLKYGIDDIRLFFENDLRFLRQFA